MKRWLAGMALVVGLAVGPGAEDTLAQSSANEAPPTAARSLARGAVLEAGDVSGGRERAAEIIGWVTRRVVGEGEPLRPPTIAPPDVIRSGDAVELVWREGAIELRFAGRAMSSAAAGESLLVRVDMQRRFEGIAEAPGVVRLASH